LRVGDELLRQWTVGNEVEKATSTAVSLALEKPVHQLVENAKRSPTQVRIEIRQSSSPSVGFNSKNGKVEDLIEAHVLDAAKVLRLAMRIAFSHAKAVLLTGTWDLSGSADNAGIATLGQERPR